MAGSAVVEVSVMMEVTVKVEADGATESELVAFVQAHADEMRGAAEKAVGQSRTQPEVGWLDDDRSVFVTEVTSAEAPTFRAKIDAGRSSVALNEPQVVR